MRVPPPRKRTSLRATQTQPLALALPRKLRAFFARAVRTPGAGISYRRISISRAWRASGVAEGYYMRGMGGQGGGRV